jgi:hypothetical protein
MSAEKPTDAEIKAIQTSAKSIFELLMNLPYPSHAANALCIANVLLIEKASDPSGNQAEQARAIAAETGQAVFNMWSARNQKV